MYIFSHVTEVAAAKLVSVWLVLARSNQQQRKEGKKGKWKNKEIEGKKDDFEPQKLIEIAHKLN